MTQNPSAQPDQSPLTQATIHVAAASRSYPIHIKPGLLAQAGERLAPLLSAKRALVIADESVWHRHGQVLADSLAAAEFSFHLLTVAGGEGSKSYSQLEQLLERALALAPDRQTAIIAFGGGVIGDLAGFAASILLRGLPFVQIPTTLLAMVDSSVGGKTGINSPHGKNLIGSFYQPHAVLIDPEVLTTLPCRQLLAGYAEVVKYGLIADADFFAWLERDGAAALDGDAAKLCYMIERSCFHKAAIVGQDEREGGVRALLNFGHTLGHALEAALGYSDALLHGEGVAIGMVFAAELSQHLGLIAPEVTQRVRQHLTAVGLPIDHRHLPAAAQDPQSLLTLMATDKKAVAGRLTFVLLDALGYALVQRDVPSDVVGDLLAEP
jgi:3-dehydroquinate synthase